MNWFLQDVLVGLLVTAAVVFSTWRLLSPRLRLRLLDVLTALPGAADWLRRWRQRLLSPATSACGGCPAQPAKVTPLAGGSTKAGGASRNQTPGALRH
ncbi:MAG: hypothetical protein PVS2B3_08420 [Steroidobacteraceae bacterium]